MEFVGKAIQSQVSRLTAQRSIGLVPSFVPNASFSKTNLARQPNRRTELDYEELSDLMNFQEEFALIDVRSPHELATYGSIPGAINIPLGEIKAAFQLGDRDFRDTFFMPKPAKRSKNLIFYARGPNASSTAVEIAHKLGYTGSRQYSGGWEDFCQKTGLPLRKAQKFSAVKSSPFMRRTSYEDYNVFSV